jgi:MoaA/NifB/PqqE/SkfB family radical SAM enzyme
MLGPPMEPRTQVEIQLGHMCNNRCVFCVSGQETALGRALPLPTEPILERLREAYETGQRKVTLLGGEPTLQPGFMSVLRYAVGLGYEEIVIFTNGVKTPRRAFLEEIIATGGNLTWRISIQGATKESHERTTRRRGSFDRIVHSMEHLRDLGQRITVNMCVVGSNYESVDRFPELLRPFCVEQLHLDMMRPLDAGQRTDAEFRDMIVPYSHMATPLTRMIDGFSGDFDANIGNLPFCVAPALAPWIHHDGETTYTVAVDGDRDLSRPWDKYFVKRRDKTKPPTCAECVFDRRCNGVFDRYRDMHGDAEFVPVTAEALRAVDPAGRLLALHLLPRLAFLQRDAAPVGFDRITLGAAHDREVVVTLEGPAPLTVALRPPGGGAASFDGFSLWPLQWPANRTVAFEGLGWLWSRLSTLGDRVWHPPGADAFAGGVSRSLERRLGRLRRAAPFGRLDWQNLVVSERGQRAELRLVAPGGEGATFWIDASSGAARAGYHTESRSPGREIVDGLRACARAIDPESAEARSRSAASPESP